MEKSALLSTSYTEQLPPGIGDVELDFKIKITIMSSNKIDAYSSEGLVWRMRPGIGSVLANAGDELRIGKPCKDCVVTVSPW